MKHIIIGLASFAFLFGISLTIISAQEQIPRDEFIRITENALDAIDKLETIFSSTGSTKMEARMAQNDLKTALKKYDRYESYKKTKAQDEIIISILMADFAYMPMVMTGSVDEKLFNDAKTYAQEARDLFGKYKQKKK